MSSRRVLKAAQAIREVVSMAILTEIKDPRVENVTVTYVEVAPDLRHAKVHVSIMGDETKKRLCMKGLESSTGFLQKRVGSRIDTRYIPRIKFVLDKGVEHSMVVTKILEEVLPGEEESSEIDQDQAAVAPEQAEVSSVGSDTASAENVTEDDSATAAETQEASDESEDE